MIRREISDNNVSYHFEVNKGFPVLDLSSGMDSDDIDKAKYREGVGL